MTEGVGLEPRPRIEAGETAVLVIDMHKGSLEFPGTVYVNGGVEICGQLNDLLRAARERNIKVVHLVHALATDGSESGNPFWSESPNVQALYPNVGQQVVGSEWATIHPAVETDSADLVLYKKRYGAFTGNGLADMLRMWGVTTLIVTGVLTEICVLATAFDAFNRDFRVIVASDCVESGDAALGDAALAIVRREIGWVMSNQEIVDCMRGASDRLAARG